MPNGGGGRSLHILEGSEAGTTFISLFVTEYLTFTPHETVHTEQEAGPSRGSTSIKMLVQESYKDVATMADGSGTMRMTPPSPPLSTMSID